MPVDEARGYPTMPLPLVSDRFARFNCTVELSAAMHRIFSPSISGLKLERFAMTRFLATLLASAALCACLPLRAHAELDVVSLKNSIEKSVESDYPKLEALYKDIHAHPEIAFQEEKTTAKLAAEMRALQ